MPLANESFLCQAFSCGLAALGPAQVKITVHIQQPVESCGKIVPLPFFGGADDRVFVYFSFQASKLILYHIAYPRMLPTSAINGSFSAEFWL